MLALALVIAGELAAPAGRWADTLLKGPRERRVRAVWALALARDVRKELDRHGPDARQVLHEVCKSDDTELVAAAAWAFDRSAEAWEPTCPLHDVAPKLLLRPEKAIRPPDVAKGISGVVDVAILIDATGRITRAEVRRSIPGLDEAAVRSVRGWVFEPARRAGKPVPIVGRVPVSFH